MPSEVDICNIALAHCDVKYAISDLTDETTEAELCNRFYEQARDDVLRSKVDWGFATKFEALALVGDPDTEAWEYAYEYPNDCVRMRYLDAGAAHFARASALPFQLALNSTGNGKLILTNAEDAIGCYTAAVDNTILFSPHFVNCVATRLAWYIIGPLKSDAQKKLSLAQEYEVALSVAAASDMNECEEGEPLPSTFVSERTS